MCIIQIPELVNNSESTSLSGKSRALSRSEPWDLVLSTHAGLGDAAQLSCLNLTFCQHNYCMMIKVNCFKMFYLKS